MKLKKIFSSFYNRLLIKTVVITATTTMTMIRIVMKMTMSVLITKTDQTFVKAQLPI